MAARSLTPSLARPDAGTDARTDEESADPRDESDDAIARLEAEIALKRERVAVSFDELRTRVHRATSWRHWAASHPIAWIGAGLFLGFIIGSAGRRRRPIG